MLFIVKEKEYIELIKSYELLKTKHSEQKRDLISQKERYQKIKKCNLSLKKLIIAIIKNKKCN